MARTPTIEVKFTGDTRDLQAATGRVEGELKGVGKSVSGFAVGAGAALTSFGIAAIPKLVDFGTELFNLGQSSEIGLRKSETVFGSSAGAIASWADEVNESLGLSDEAVVGLAAGMGDLLVPLGFTREAAADMSMQTTELSGALSAWSQGQYDSAQVSEILTKAMLGERDGLKALGISISQAEVDQRALTLAQAEGRDEITAQDKALATQQLILEKSTDAQTAWSDGTMDAVKSQNELSATIADAKEGLAKGLVPVVQNVVKWITSDLIPAVRQGIEVFKRYWPQIKEAVLPTMQAIQEVVQSVLTLVAELWRRYGSDIVDQVVSQFQMIRSTIEAAMQIIQGIIDVVMGLISGDWGRVWDGIKGIFGGVWDAMVAMLTRALDILKTLMAVAWEAIKRLVEVAWDGIKAVVSGAISAVVGYVTGMPGRISGTISSLWNGLKTGITDAKDWIGNRIDDIVDFVTGIPGRVSTAVSDAFGAIPRAFKSAINGIIDAWNNLSFRIKGGPWDPLGSFGPEIPAVNFGFDTPNIPRLFRGGLAYGPSLAVVGDNVGVKADPEVIAPLSKLVPLLRTAMTLDPISSSRRTSRTSGSTTIIQNIPTGVTPTTVMQASRQYERTQGPV